MRYSIEPKYRIYVKIYRFLSFPKNMRTYLSSKYSQKLLDTAKKSTTDVIKTTSKRGIQKTAKAIGDFFGNKIAHKIIRTSKKYNRELPNEDKELTTHKKRYIYVTATRLEPTTT